ncbi:MAG: phage replisome organizer N-terminal domain-containing protein, partial [Clostridia bacterium]|nr:phage replisome organizer N-terminal domain-containing protein [Clostridia bacterium]
MARVKWIKLFTDLFEDEKIIMLSTRQNGESLILMWLKLLCLAGKINDGGAITIGEQKPYTAEMLSKILHKTLDETNSALDIFEEYDMISRKNGIVKILSWDRYQNVKSLKKIKVANAKKQEEKRKEERRDIEIRDERIR